MDEIYKTQAVYNIAKPLVPQLEKMYLNMGVLKLDKVTVTSRISLNCSTLLEQFKNKLKM